MNTLAIQARTDQELRTADRLYGRRRIANVVAIVLACATALFGLFFLGWILWTLVTKGIGGINWALFTQNTPPPMQEGGLMNAFFGSAVMCVIAILIGTPLGIAAGTWLAEYGHARKIGTVVRFVNDILLSAPSIVLGLFVYTLVVATTGHFSALAGAIALAFIVLPVVVRTTDDMLRLVPSQMREAALSLGIPQWKVTLQILYRGAIGGIVTGELGLGALEMALEAADALNLPLMTHIGTAPPSYADVVDMLRPGDILTHCYRPDPNSAIGPDGKVIDAVLKARERGVLFDIAHGMGAFGYDSAEAALKDGFKPDVISSDVHVIAGAGHFPHRDRPGEFVAMLLEFVEQNPAASYHRGRWRAMLRRGDTPELAAASGDDPTVTVAG